MADILNLVINATIISGLYAVVAIGFTLIFGVGGVLNFAHGALITAGAFAGYVVSNPSQGLPVLGVMHPAAALVAGALFSGVLAGLMYKGVIRYVEDQPVTLLILTFVLGFFAVNALRVIYGATKISIPQVLSGATSFAGQSVQDIRLFIFLLSWAIILGVFYFVNNTKTGKAILATSMTDKGAALVGIDSERINLYTWLMAGTFAGLAGVLLTMLRGGSWSMGTSPLILSFSIVILGGLGSIRGSVVGAYIIGFVDTITVRLISTQLAGLSALVFLVVFLLVKPEGLFGREAAE